MEVDTVPDPRLGESTDAIIEVTSTNICGSDLHLYEIPGAFMKVGDILGDEPMESFVRLGPPSPTSPSTTESSFHFKSPAAVATCAINSSSRNVRQPTFAAVRWVLHCLAPPSSTVKSPVVRLICSVFRKHRSPT
jgi:hypothetical protein